MRSPARFLAAWWLGAVAAPAATDTLIAKADALTCAPHAQAPYLGLFTHVEPRLDLPGKLATLNQIIRDNPHIIGFTLKIHWRQLHPEPKRWDWDGFEALVAAIYLDGGFDAAATFLRQELKAAVDAGRDPSLVVDYKSALQERLQALGQPLPQYRLAGESGPDHQKLFQVDVVVAGAVRGSASGRAKKEAEQDAARQALASLDASPTTFGQD